MHTTQAAIACLESGRVKPSTPTLDRPTAADFIRAAARAASMSLRGGRGLVVRPGMKVYVLGSHNIQTVFGGKSVTYSGFHH
jgi:hypothetical protein